VANKKSSSRKEPSDLFKVEEATPSIAPVDRIVLPPEEALKRRIRRLIAAGIAAVIFFFLVHMILGWIHAARLASALDEVINDGSPDTIENALTLLREDPNDSVRARLLATAALGGNRDRLLATEELLSKSSVQNDPDQRIARIYAFLAEGDARAAHAEAERPAKYSEQADAFLYGRALTAVARGQWAQALADAQTVVDSRPGAPEPAALLARITAQTVDLDRPLLAAVEVVQRDVPPIDGPYPGQRRESDTFAQQDWVEGDDRVVLDLLPGEAAPGHHLHLLAGADEEVGGT